MKLLVVAGSMALALSGGLGATNAAAVPSSPSKAVAIGQSFVAPQAKKTKKTKITKQPGSATIGRYGTRTSITFKVKATGTKLRYRWQHHPASGGVWKTISGAKKSKYTAKVSSWSKTTLFRVVVKGKKGTKTSKTVTLTVAYPTNTPAADAQRAFGLTGVTQGVDLSAWQYSTSGKIRMSAVASWVGNTGFTILRNGSGSRPIKTSYTDICTGKANATGSTPVTKDCAYPTLADAATARKVHTGHYWFNGWISSIDTTSSQAFAGGYTPEQSAQQFVALLLADGNYTKASTDPLVLDIEAGSAWTKTVSGKKKTLKLRAWSPSEATRFLNTTKALLTADGYQANLYVYMSANATAVKANGSYLWQDVAKITRLWVASWGTNNGRIPTAQPKTGPWTTWSIWQYTCEARISGSGVGGLDADIAKADAWTPR
ncbi:MAG: hypothetical protein FP817_01765 [Propionicimonas sp.]|nr:hypothetical protein [Propionicimonas sp.]MBU4363928.1 hypothetical protein [Actinomycetota bacterium]